MAKIDGMMSIRGQKAARGDTNCNLPPTHPIASRPGKLKAGEGRGGARGGKEGLREERRREGWGGGGSVCRG